jgi:hypothetical protein
LFYFYFIFNFKKKRVRIEIIKTRICLIQKNSLIVFDEGNDKSWPGEKKALNEFFKTNKKSYQKEYIKFARQPDVILKKIS